MRKKFIIYILVFCLYACGANKNAPVKDMTETSNSSQNHIPNIHPTFERQYINKLKETITLDGTGEELSWKNANWRQMDQVMLGTKPSSDDFSGRYKLLWDENLIYVLAEITDDVFMDIHKDGLDNYWNDDCLEIFIDADRSGDNHQYNYNAFAYHISLDDKVVDIGDDRKPKYFDQHLELSKSKTENVMTWEIGIKVYSDQFYEDDPEASRLKLKSRDQLGFMVAYCDNDYSDEREHFIGDMFIEGEDKNVGWINASVFGTINLRED